MSKNILFIVADDLNSWIEPLGSHPDVKTPNIKRLAERSTVFSRAYCTAPYCNASRMSVFTGLLPHHTGIYRNEPFWETPLRHATYIEKLKDGGFYCFGAGKVFHGHFDYATAGRDKAPTALWHDIQNRKEIWDEFHPSAVDPMPPKRPLNGMFNFERFDEVHPRDHLFDWGVLPTDRESEMPDTSTVENVTAFLKNPPQQPFLCAAGFYKPHLPWYVPQRFIDLYPLDAINLPFVKHDDLDDVPAIPRQWVESRPDHQTVLDNDQWRHAVQGYLASISYCDSQIGQLLDALDASPAADDTVIVLWGDNGFHLGEKLHWRKFVLWEEATRVPLLISPASGNSSRPSVDEPVSLVDIWPTLCDLAEIDISTQSDGVSLADLMYGRSASRGRPVITTWLEGNHSVRSGQWRYTRYRDDTEELYDHASDPYEWNNRSTHLQGSDTLISLREMLAKSKSNPG